MTSRKVWLKSGVLISALAMFGGCSHHDYPKNYREYAYVTNTGSNTVSVIDVLSLKKVKDITVGAEPTGVTANPKRNEVYVVNAGSGTVSVIDAVRNEVVATIQVGKRPYFVDVVGEAAAVANSADNTVSIINVGDRKVERTISVGGEPGYAKFAPQAELSESSFGLRNDPIPATLFVAERSSGTVTVADGLGHKLASVAACADPTDLVAPSRTRVFVACSGEGKVAVIGSDDSGQNWKLYALLPVGKTPTNLALKPDTGEIFVTNFGSNTISEIVTGDATVNATYYIGAKPTRGLVSADNSLLYVTNFDSNNVSMFSIDNGHLFGTVAVGSHPDAMALSNNQSFLLVADSGSNDVAVVRTKVTRGDKPALLTLIPVGARPSGIAIKAFLR